MLQQGAVSLSRVTDPAENKVREFVRLSSPACRLTRQSRTQVDLGDRAILAGHELIINIRAANRDPSARPDADIFRPARWEMRESKRNDLNFDKGARSCPAQSAAVSALSDFQAALDSGFHVSFWRAPLSRPLVGTLLAPPLGVVRIRQGLS